MDKNRDDKRKVGYESRASTTGSRVNIEKGVEGRGTTVRDKGRLSRTRNDSPGQGTTFRDEGRESGTRDNGLRRGTMVWDKG